MTDTRPPVARAPWITAAALGAVAIALAGVVLFVIRPDRHRHEAAARAVGFARHRGSRPWTPHPSRC